MNQKLSPRLLEIVNALPLHKGIRILEIGCGSGAAAREISKRIDSGFILGIDRSEKAIIQARKSSKAEIATGRLNFLQVAIEDFEWKKTEPLFDIAFAVRVGALDGRHPEINRAALSNISKCLTDKGRLFIDGGNPLKEITYAVAKRKC